MSTRPAEESFPDDPSSESKPGLDEGNKPTTEGLGVRSAAVVDPPVKHGASA